MESKGHGIVGYQGVRKFEISVQAIASGMRQDAARARRDKNPMRSPILLQKLGNWRKRTIKRMIDGLSSLKAEKKQIGRTKDETNAAAGEGVQPIEADPRKDR